MKPASALIGVLLLAAASALVQSWLIVHASVPAADSIGFVSVAQSFDSYGVRAALQADASPPMFPLLVWAAHGALVHAGCIAESCWGTAAQIAAAVPLSLAIGLSWLLFRYSVPTPAAIVAAVFAAVLTLIARLGADGLSDSTHLLLLTIGLWAIVSSLSGQSLNGNPLAKGISWAACLRLVAGGAALACAQLTRVEAAVVIPALVMALAIEVCIAKQISAGRASLTVASLAAGWLLVIGPFLAACQTGSPAEAIARLWGRRGPSERMPLNVMPGTGTALSAQPNGRPPNWQLADGQRMAFGRKDTATSIRFRSPVVAVAELARELAQSLNYVLGPLALAGLWFSRSQIRRPVDAFLTLLVIAHLGGALVVATTQGYLAGRHVLPVVWLTLPWAGAGVCQLGQRLAIWLSARWYMPRVASAGRATTLAMTIAIVCGCLTTTLVPLHASHEGHRRAVEWLAAEASNGAVLDSAGFTALYSGRKTYRYAAAADALRDPDLAYLVIQRGELTAPTARGATMRELLDRCAEPAAIFAPPDARGAARTVLLFRWRPREFAQYLRGNHAR